MQLRSVIYRSRRRIRLVFDHTLAAAAFSDPPADHYEVTSVDSLGTDPGAAVAALIVADSPHVVELALGEDLVGGALYEVACTDVPSTEPATFTGTLRFRPLAPKPAPSPSVSVADVDAELYQVDLVWNGRDIAEAASGDLATVGGLANMQNALEGIVESDGLPWEPAHGAHARGYVDAPSPMKEALRGGLVRAILRDDRARAVSSTVLADDNTGRPLIGLDVELIGKKRINLTADPASPRNNA